MAGNSKAGSKSKMRNVNNMAYLFVIPFVVVFLIFNVYPVLRTFYLSFTNLRGAGSKADLIWLDNYVRVIKDKFFWRAVLNTLRMWVPNIILQLGIAFLLTMVFSDVKYRMRGLGIFRALFYLPNLIAATSVAWLFRTLLDHQYGSINQMLLSMGVITNSALGDAQSITNWLGNPRVAPYVVSIIQAWMWFGNSFIMLMASVQGINRDYFEAAAIDGAGRWTTFGKITIPLIRPILLYVAITSLIGGLQLFDIPYLINGQGSTGLPDGKLQTAVMYLYKFGFESGTKKQVGYASAVAYTLFALILIISLVQILVLNRKEEQ